MWYYQKMLNAIRRFFKFEELGTNFHTEIIAGVTTFSTMSYILIVNPKILAAAGMPFGASLTATILAAFVACVLMGLYANRPFGVAPYMGENAFIAYTVVLLLGFTWQQALGAIFLSGVLFFILTLLSVRPYLVNSIPKSLKLSFTVGLGLFLIFVGLINTKIIETAQGAPVKIGDFHNPQVLLALLGLVVMIVLMTKKVKAPIFIGILAITAIALIRGDITLPQSIVCAPPSIAPIFGKLDILGILNFKALPLIFILVVLIFVDTMGTLIGVSYRGGFLDEKGNLPELHKPMYVDAFATALAAVLGTSTTGVYAESATGIESGGKSGFVAVIVGVLFLSGLFFAPLFSIIPPAAYGPALIIVGMLMFTTASKLNFEDWTEAFPAICTIVLIVFTYNVGIGMAGGFLLYPILKVLTGRNSENNPAVWFLAVMSVLFFVLYPY